MSYKALLFCPDEKTARAVTQVLSELDFAVESSRDPFATVKKLTGQPYDALVVDCQNEQDASLLFKSARDSSSNHNSLAVAVVEGQAGVAKAFRIGANLVLTKPINIEQSKSTLRVARGLLKKSETKTATAAVNPSGAPSSNLFAAKPAAPAPIPAPAADLSPFSSLEVEADPEPTTEAAEAAVLESMPDPIKPASSAPQLWAPTMKNSAEPIAASTASHSGAAAAPAMARMPLEIKPAPVEIKPAPPLASQDPIMDSQYAVSEPAVTVSAPTFAQYGEATEGGSRKTIIALAAIALAIAGLGYLVVRNPQLIQKLHRSAGSEPAAVTSPVEASLPAEPAPLPAEDSRIAESHSTPAAPTFETTPVAPTSKPIHVPPIETIHVDETATTDDSQITVTPKPLVVNTKPAPPSAAKANPAAAPAPPSISVGDNPESTLANLVTTETALPKAVPGSVRVSQGVSQGLLVKRVAPVYPAIAMQLRKQGSVELLAKISKSGDITSVQVLKGDSVLARSAADAVRQWKYRPYLLNGEPVEIETQITVNFTLPR